MFKTPTPQPLVTSYVGMNVAGWLCIAVGLGTLLIVTRQNVAATGGSLGVLLIFLDLTPSLSCALHDWKIG
jgi:hypothetical protein